MNEVFKRIAEYYPDTHGIVTDDSTKIAIYNDNQEFMQCKDGEYSYGNIASRHAVNLGDEERALDFVRHTRTKSEPKVEVTSDYTYKLILGYMS